MRPRSVQFVVVLRGGQSAEHDVSLRSSQFVEAGLMAAGYEVAAIDIDRAGRWRAGGSDRSTANVSQAALASLDKADVVFPVLHGPMGEDGTVQGFLEVLGKPYVGCTVPGSAIAMDKGVSKALARAAGIPVLPAFVAVAADAETAAARTCFSPGHFRRFPLSLRCGGPNALFAPALFACSTLQNTRIRRLALSGRDSFPQSLVRPRRVEVPSS